MDDPAAPAPHSGSDLAALAERLQSLDAQLAALETGGAHDEAARHLAGALASIDEIEGLLDDLQQARAAWQEALAATAGEVDALVADLQEALAAVQDTAATHVETATAASQALESAVQERLEQLVDDAAGQLQAAEAAFGEAMRAVATGTDELRGAASALRLEQVHAAGTEVFAQLNVALDDIEAAGAGAAAGVIDTLDDITRQIDAIVQVITGIRPALDAVAAIA